MVLARSAIGPELDWLLDDTEESLLGTSIHQTVIVDSDSVLNRHKRNQQLPWLIGNQLKLLIPRQNGGVYQPSPDILVHATLGDLRLSSLPVAQYGPPALAIEIASPATARSHDLDTLNPDAKPLAYAQAGIAEYLFYDPLEEFVPGRIRAWRLATPTTYEAWEAHDDGRWHSALGISFLPESGGILLRIYDGDGNRIPTNAEVDAQLRDERQHRAAEQAEFAARIAELEAALRRQRDD